MQHLQCCHFFSGQPVSSCIIDSDITAMDSEDKDLYKTCSCLEEHVSLKYSFLIIIPKVGQKQNCQFYSCDGQLYLPADKRG